MACYPATALGGRPAICTSCYASQSCVTGNGGAQPAPCSAHCNTGCNTVCVSIQNYCSIGVEYLERHTDIGPYTFPPCMVFGEIIMRNWTATWWNGLIDKLMLVPIIGNGSGEGGLTPNQGTFTRVTADTNLGTNSTHPQNSLITAAKYNQLANYFTALRSPVPTVNVDDVIRGIHAQALQTGWNGAKFATVTCDICNTAGNQNANNCNCACVCTCGCQCLCGPCLCLCQCSCSCSCSCGP